MRVLLLCLVSMLLGMLTAKFGFPIVVDGYVSLFNFTITILISLIWVTIWFIFIKGDKE